MKEVKNILLLLIALLALGCSQTIIFEDSQTPKPTPTPKPNIPNNEIWYTSKDGTVVEPDSSADFGATIVSNTYENGKGVIKFNKDLYTIGQYAFDHKPILTVVLPKTVRVIEKDAFSYTPLKSVVLSDELTSIGAEAFEYCNLETIDFGDFIGDVGEFAFRATSVDAVYVSSLPQWCSIDFGGWDANPLAGGGSKTCLYVNNEKLTTLTFHNGLTEIKPYLFNHCKDLEEVVIHDNITRIGKHAFRYSDVRKVTIGKNVQYIGDSAFNCLSLMEIHCKSLTPPELEKINVFAQLHSSCKIYVPFESLDLYKSAYGWSEYKNQIVTITTSAPYTVGDYYCDGEKEGVVFDVWDNGNSGKIVSMTQSASGLQWSSDEAEQKRFLGAESYTDGAANTAKIKAISGWQNKYPAFKWCADLGGEWYLPAKEELELFTLDNTVHNAVNNTLLAKGGTKLYDEGTGECYWSSTDINYQVSSGIYCAWYVYMRDGSSRSSEKSVTNYVRAVTTFGNVPKSEPEPEPEPEPEDKQFTSAPYSVGDYYYDGTKEGVVFDVWDNGNSGKILSMTQSASGLQWTSDLTEQNRLVGANSETDGAVNMAVVKAISGWQSKYPAFKWCADLGSEWYLPAKEELLTIYNGKDKLNTKLTDELISESYWSSTECDQLTSGEYCAWGVSMYNSCSTESAYKRYYKRVRAVTTFGNVPKPEPEPEPEPDLDYSTANDLSAAGTANCYLVKTTGKYKFKAVKGNSAQSVGAASSADVLWESFGTSTKPNEGDLMASAIYKDGYVYFATPNTFKSGNASIAVRNSSGTILWSWHIWCSAEGWTDDIYLNNAGAMMDRNLGATSATPGDVGAFGLLYQWGRKDPFLGSCSISSNRLAVSTGSWNSVSTQQTVDYVTANPMIYVCGNSEWCIGDGANDSNYTKRWIESAKSMYDPCPVGYRIPDGGNDGFWARALGTSNATSAGTTWDSTNKGHHWTLSDGTTAWYPVVGVRNYDSGALHNVGLNGYCWSASPNPGYSYSAYHLYFNSGYVLAASGYNRGYGQSVRCVRE